MEFEKFFCEFDGNTVRNIISDMIGMICVSIDIMMTTNIKETDDEAMTRFRQERGSLKHQKIVRVPRPVVVCQGEVRQAVAANVQKEEQKMLAEPTTIVGAVKVHNKLNDGKVMAAQQRLRNKGTAVLDRSDSSVEFVAEVKENPERERKPVVRLTPPVMDEVVTPGVQAVSTRRRTRRSPTKIGEPD